jgi:hypothetical protein
MIAWITVKMVSNWNRAGTVRFVGLKPGKDAGEDTAPLNRRIRGAFCALLAGLVSMGFALIGGLIAYGKICFPPLDCPS